MQILVSLYLDLFWTGSSVETKSSSNSMAFQLCKNFVMHNYWKFFTVERDIWKLPAGKLLGYDFLRRVHLARYNGHFYVWWPKVSGPFHIIDFEKVGHLMLVISWNLIISSLQTSGRIDASSWLTKMESWSQLKIN